MGPRSPRTIPGALIPNLSCDIDGLLEVLDGALVVSEALIDVSARIRLAGAMPDLSKQRQRFGKALLGVFVVGLLPLNRPQLNEPLSRPKSQAPSAFSSTASLDSSARSSSTPSTAASASKT